jgi:hypothetical protein
MGLVGTYNLSFPDVAGFVEECVHSFGRVIEVLTGYQFACDGLLA